MGRRSVLGAALLLLLLLAAVVAGRLLLGGGPGTPVSTDAMDPTPDALAETPRTHSAPPQAPRPPDAEETTSPYAGGVVEDEAGVPVEGARILVREHTEIAGDIVEANIDAADAPACVTDADGRFTLQDEPEDIATLVVLADEFEIAEVREPHRDMRIVLRSCEALRTRIVDSAGRPIADARVVVVGSIDWDAGGRRTSVVTHTGADGRAKLGSVPADARVGSILVSGYALPELSKTPFGVELRDEYALLRTSVIVDVRSADDGTPVPEARGIVSATAGSVVGTLAPGGSRFTRVTPPGRLLWRPARACTGIPLTLRLFAPGRVSRLLSITLSDGIEPPHVEATLSLGDEPPSISGRVLGGAGTVLTVRARPEYLDGFHLQAADHQLPPVVAATVGDDGTFAFTGLPPATYCITLEHPDRPFTSLDVVAPANGLELRFPPQAALEVTLTDESGEPLPDAWVHVQTADGKGVWELRTDAAGRALFDPIAAGELDILPVRNPAPISAVVYDHPAMPHERVEPAAGETARVTLVRPASAALTVIVREDSGAPVRDATIRVKMYRGLGAFLRKERQRIEAQHWLTDADGRVTLDLPPCGGSITARSRERSATAKYSTTDAEPVEIVLATRFGIVRGRVVDLGTGQPVPGRPISIRSDGQRAGGDITDSDGRFVVGRVPAGRVKISVDGRQNADGTFESASPYPYASTEIDLAGDEDRAVEIAVPRVRGDDAAPASSTLTVRVTEPDLRPAKGATVIAYGRFGDVVAMLADDRVDADGRVSLRLPDADGYSVVGFVGARSTEVEVSELPEDELQIRLPAE